MITVCTYCFRSKETTIFVLLDLGFTKTLHLQIELFKMKYLLESTLSFVKNVLIKSLTHSLFHKEVFWNVSYQLNFGYFSTIG